MPSFVRSCITLFALTAIAHGQKMDDYIRDLSEALSPYAVIQNTACRNLMVEVHGPWGNFAVPDGIDKEHPGEPTWSVVGVDVAQIWINLSKLDEDKIQGLQLFSLKYISKHQRGTPYVANTPAVAIFTKGLNTEMTVNTVNLDKVRALQGQSHITEAQMGWGIDERKSAILIFKDQEHADAFKKAIEKAIVLCKAQ